MFTTAADPHAAHCLFCSRLSIQTNWYYKKAKSRCPRSTPPQTPSYVYIMVCYRRIRLLPAHHQSWSITPLCKISALPAAEISPKNKEQRTENPYVLLELRHSIGACLAFLKAEDLPPASLPNLHLLKTNI